MGIENVNEKEKKTPGKLDIDPSLKARLDKSVHMLGAKGLQERGDRWDQQQSNREEGGVSQNRKASESVSPASSKNQEVIAFVKSKQDERNIKEEKLFSDVAARQTKKTSDLGENSVSPVSNKEQETINVVAKSPTERQRQHGEQNRKQETRLDSSVSVVTPVSSQTHAVGTARAPTDKTQQIQNLKSLATRKGNNKIVPRRRIQIADEPEKPTPKPSIGQRIASVFSKLGCGPRTSHVGNEAAKRASSASKTTGRG